MLSVVTHVCNSIAQVAEAEGSPGVQGQSYKIVLMFLRKEGGVVGWE